MVRLMPRSTRFNFSKPVAAARAGLAGAHHANVKHQQFGAVADAAHTVWSDARLYRPTC